jgi:hypothetical protein
VTAGAALLVVWFLAAVVLGPPGRAGAEGAPMSPELRLLLAGVVLGLVVVLFVEVVGILAWMHWADARELDRETYGVRR